MHPQDRFRLLLLVANPIYFAQRVRCQDLVLVLKVADLKRIVKSCSAAFVILFSSAIFMMCSIGLVSIDSPLPLKKLSISEPIIKCTSSLFYRQYSEVSRKSEKILRTRVFDLCWSELFKAE